MARKHYHVLAGTPGCLPDYNAAHTSRRAAALTTQQERKDHANAQ